MSPGSNFYLSPDIGIIEEKVRRSSHWERSLQSLMMR